MGYALFTARKLSLNTRLNNCNAKLASATEREYALSQTIFAKQQALSQRVNKENLEALQAYTAAISQEGADKDQAKADLDEKMKEIEIASTMDNAEIFGLNQQQTMLDMEKKNYETQLKAFQNELEAVQKSEESAIKNSTPKFS